MEKDKNTICTFKVYLFMLTNSKNVLSIRGIPLGLQQTKGQEKPCRTERERKIMRVFCMLITAGAECGSTSCSSWMTPLYCHGTLETDQTAWRRPVSTLKTPSLSSDTLYTTTECFGLCSEKMCRECAKRTRRRPVCSSASVTLSKGRQKSSNYFHNVNFIVQGHFGLCV